MQKYKNIIELNIKLSPDITIIANIQDNNTISVVFIFPLFILVSFRICNIIDEYG